MTTRRYHHGDLRRVLLDAAAAAITEHGPAALSLRELARRAGVSHAAPVHHFGDKAGVLTALATEGFELLARALGEAGDFAEVGVAYVRFGLEHRGHFEVMFRRDLLRADDAGLAAAMARAGERLGSGVRGLLGEAVVDDLALGRIAAWSLVHGFATLHLAGALPDAATGAPLDTAREIARVLVRGLHP